MYINTLLSEDAKHQFVDLYENIEKSVNTTDVNNSSPLFKKNIKHYSKTNFKNRTNVPYFDNDCKKVKSNYYTCLNSLRKISCNENRANMVQARSEYKNRIR